MGQWVHGGMMVSIHGTMEMYGHTYRKSNMWDDE